MTSPKFVKKIRNYTIVSFLVPLITINLCFFIFKYLGDVSKTIGLYPSFDWNIEKFEYSYNEYYLILKNVKTHTITNCPKNSYYNYFITTGNEKIEHVGENLNLIASLGASNKIESIIFERQKKLEHLCVKNHKSLYSLLKKFSLFETILVRSIQGNPVGFSQIKNPYFYGEVSISRTARYFPTILIFKPLMILSSFFLFLYWKSNLNLFNELKNKNIFDKFSKKFFYFGLFSCIFLMLHAIFLGLDFDSKLFSKIRRLIIILFIFSEIFAQIFLTINIFKFKEQIKKYINPLILKIKIVFVAIVFFSTCIAFAILVFGEPSTRFKHVLEWNYFTFLLLYYFLSRLLWKKEETLVHTPEGA